MIHFFLVSQVLLTLPELSRVNYFHLSSKPLLMLEQLLMNMKVDWVAVAVQTLHQLLAEQEIGFTVEDIDSLLSKYAEKALNFPFTLKEKRSGNCLSECWFSFGKARPKSSQNNFSNCAITFFRCVPPVSL